MGNGQVCDLTTARIEQVAGAQDHRGQYKADQNNEQQDVAKPIHGTARCLSQGALTHNRSGRLKAG